MTPNAWTTTELRWTPCRMDGCRCGLPHLAYAILAAAGVYLAAVLLASLSSYVPTLP